MAIIFTTPQPWAVVAEHGHNGRLHGIAVVADVRDPVKAAGDIAEWDHEARKHGARHDEDGTHYHTVL